MAKIMVVDDAAFMRMMIKDALTKGGYTDLCEAGDGEAAVDLYKTEKPQLVLLDITMPKMNGLEALKAIKAHDPGATVIMCSAMGQEAIVIDAIKAGAKDFIVKPFKPNRIIDAVSKVIG